jgi:hypothetical protein
MELFFFAEKAVTSMTYLDMLPQLEGRQRNVVLQQVGALPHIELIFSDNLLTCIFLRARLGVID